MKKQRGSLLAAFPILWILIFGGMGGAIAVDAATDSNETTEQVAP